ncbi:hypothetical protein RBG61_05875 [Paludicola sp. MB14-C6]|nr:hypothetical protein [Paludicola sp. MB14-C6]WMJ24193.1 hypothetical protein RBG61_05875 [Paludicola sp. MB14-C6]
MTTDMEPLLEQQNNLSKTLQEEWFSVDGDLDDFIFYGQSAVAESER